MHMRLKVYIKQYMPDREYSNPYITHTMYTEVQRKLKSVYN